MLSSILQRADADRSACDDATLVVLGLLATGRSFETFLQRAAPPVDPAEPADPAPPDAPMALALGILAFHRHLTARLDALLPENASPAQVDTHSPGAARGSPSPHRGGLLR
jgi:hypothetical protein